MTLLQKLNKELEKEGLEFKSEKELREKFKGVLIDKKTQTEIPYEIQKVLQWDRIPSFAKMSREHIDMYIKVAQMMKK